MPEAGLTRGYVSVAGRQIHYRRGGNGPPVVMLHPSPLSSTALLPMANALAEYFTVVALDTPGYGQSDPMPAGGEQLRDYARYLATTLDALGLQRVCLYGAATGAQLAVAFALEYPERSAQVVMDAAGHVDDADCDRILADYFPNIEPRSDGSHLPTIWQAARDLAVFFPWSDRRSETRLALDVPPPAIVQQTVNGYLDAGSDYARAYRAAFLHERAAPVQALKVPTVVTRWESSIVLGMTDALLAHELPSNVSVLRLAGGIAARLAGVSQYLRENYHGSPAALPMGSSMVSRLQRGFSGAAGKQLHHYRRSGTGRPLVMLHDCDSSAANLRSVADGWPAGQPLVLLDLPDHGESDQLLKPEAYSIADAAESLTNYLADLDCDSFDLLGFGGGGVIALEVARRHPTRVKALGLCQPWQLDELERPDFMSEYAPDLRARWDGTHLLSAWQMLRDQALFWPWFRRQANAIRAEDPGAEIDPEFLQSRLVALMKCVDRYQDTFAATFEYPLVTRLGDLKRPALMAGLRGHPLTARLDAAGLALPADRRRWGQILAPALAAAG